MLPENTRMTAARRAVVAAIERRRDAFTVADILEDARVEHPALGLATAYRTVELLRRAGSVHALPGAAYVRCGPKHHHHLVCTSCGAVEDTELCAAPPDEELRQRHGFRAATHELDIYGLCKRCA